MAIYALDGVSPRYFGAGPAFVADDAHVIGQINLHEDCSVWFGCVLRGDNEPVTIGARTNVQEHTVMHTDMGFPLTLGKGVTVGHNVMMHGCTVDDYSLIGINAVILNGAKIGKYCIIGANALIPEGKEIPPGALVMGAPGKVVRMLDAAAIEAHIVAVERIGEQHIGARVESRDELRGLVVEVGLHRVAARRSERGAARFLAGLRAVLEALVEFRLAAVGEVRDPSRDAEALGGDVARAVVAAGLPVGVNGFHVASCVVNVDDRL